MTMSQSDLEEIRSVNAMFVYRDNWGDLFEELTLSIYSAVLGYGDSAIDCGTNHGIHTRAMARACGADGRVFAFEAAPAMVEQSKAATVSFNNITFVEKAVWHTSGEKLTFNFYPNEDGLSGLVARSGTTSTY